MNKLLLIGSASATAATALTEGLGCSAAAVADDTNNEVYSAPVEVEASSADVDAATCFAAVDGLTAADRTDAAGKVSCVEVVADAETEGNNICQYIYEVAETAAEDWDPIAC